MAAVYSFAWGPLLFLVLPIIAFTTWGLIALWRGAWRKPTDTLAHCGQCGYAVEGLEKMSCPECGADFRKVGIVSPAQLKPPTSLLAFSVAWGLILLLLALIASNLPRVFGLRLSPPAYEVLLFLCWLLPFALGVYLVHQRHRRT